MLHLLLYGLPLAFLRSTGRIIWIEHPGNTWQISEQWPELKTSPLLCTPYVQVFELLPDTLVLSL
jgi:hypothetical protein